MNKLKYAFLAFGFVVGLQACTQKTVKGVSNDDFTSGKVTFAVDNSFEPIVGQEMYIFKSRYPNADPTVLYLTENHAINLLLNDSVRVAILSRDLDTAEINVLKRRSLDVKVLRFAIDAVTLIVNKNSKDTLASVGELKKMLNGLGDPNRSIVFDNPNSSLVRYLKELSGNKEFKQKNIYALKSNKEVIKYVSEHPDALGITGYSWLVDPDKEYAPYVDNIKIVGVKDEANKNYPNQYFKPSQETLVLKQYPLSRGLYIVDCSSKTGLAMGFASFIAGDVGQRIILRSGLLPDKMPPREINVRSKL
ncbi:PstS family phosphate ABC transporter substrate-binding protein [Mucilaginibacter sp. FT3.2]|uniref:PstS family phosphate ABC transporter substrate-binding protein n=1 Tax=Mucilaginibacter sp. FT3.2 TaxID=2723090 RepID=UPI00160B68D8|nr:substrate-binding domain-containing protein [Mucilaginibacter sp. FT3.2]MBB6230988.1 phosphate transport system substrate-binding protein [Mucilaginibacter sp. FT3.2]